jgi:ribonuclease E
MVSTIASVEPETLAPVASAIQPAPIADERVREDISPPNSAQPITRSKAAPAPLQLDWSSDLIQVETHPEKARIALARTREEPPAPRVKRERLPLPPLSAEPLIQVETRKNDVTVNPVAVVQNAGGEPLSMTTG